jgi:hypothetical protein
MSNEISVSKSNVGVLNTGEIKEIRSVSLNVSALAQIEHTEMATALRQLVGAVSKSEELTKQQRSEILEQLEEIARQANTPPERRVTSGVLKSALSGIATTLGAAGGLAEVWSTWGPAIATFFGL